MDNIHREKMIERFEVIARAADECVYHLSDDTIPTEELLTKLQIRRIRIGSELIEVSRLGGEISETEKL